MQQAPLLTHVPCRHREEAVTKMIQAFPLETVMGRGRAVHPCDVHESTLLSPLLGY